MAGSSDRTVLFLSGNAEDIRQSAADATSLGLHLAVEALSDDYREKLEDDQEDLHEARKKEHWDDPDDDDDCIQKHRSETRAAFFLSPAPGSHPGPGRGS